MRLFLSLLLEQTLEFLDLQKHHPHLCLCCHMVSPLCLCGQTQFLVSDLILLFIYILGFSYKRHCAIFRLVCLIYFT